jgi:hypothetical protein
MGCNGGSDEFPLRFGQIEPSHGYQRKHLVPVLKYWSPAKHLLETSSHLTDVVQEASPSCAIPQAIRRRSVSRQLWKPIVPTCETRENIRGVRGKALPFPDSGGRTLCPNRGECVGHQLRPISDSVNPHTTRKTLFIDHTWIDPKPI